MTKFTPWECYIARVAFPHFFGNKIAYTSSVLLFCRIKPLNKGAILLFRNIARIKFKVASGKPKRKLQKLISQEQEEKENSKKSKLFKRLPHSRAGILKTHEGRLCHHVEFTLCHMVAYRPIRHFTPVNSICLDFH